jgi:hypothetical protein
MTDNNVLFRRYFADHGDGAAQPASDVEIDEVGLYQLVNVNGDLAVYRETSPDTYVLLTDDAPSWETE